MMHMITLIAPIIVLFGAFYFFMIRPEKKKQTKYSNMLDDLKVNDRIITRGGIIARIIKINEDELLIESEGTRMKISKQGVNTKLEK